MKKPMSRPIWALAALGALLPEVGWAAVFRSGDGARVGRDETIDEDLYVAGDDVYIAGVVRGDLIAAGGSVTVGGEVQGSVIAAGGTVRVLGEVGRAARLAGGEVVVVGRVGGDVVAFGGSVTTAPEARVGGDVVASGGTLRVGGEVGGSASARGGEIELTATVAEEAALEGDRVQVSGAASVARVLSVRADEASIDPGARAGELRRLEPRGGGWPLGASVVLGVLGILLSTLVTGLTMLRFFRARAAAAVGLLAARPGRAGGFGLAALFLTPLLVLVAFAVVIGVPLGLVGTALYFVGLYLGYVTACLAVGALLLARRRGDPPAAWARPAALALGVVIVGLLGLVPVIGWLVSLSAAVLGLGALLLTARGEAALVAAEPPAPPPPRPRVRESTASPPP